ncbi:MAG: transporter related protein [Actinomycetia bacterium]|nr:transporter related protein [Actinomycetes bacterium]
MAASERLDRARPPIYRGLPYLSIALVILGIVLYRNTRTSGFAQESLFNDWLVYAIVVLGFYFVFGLSGQFAFSQAAIFGLGAYTSAWATFNPDHPILLGLLAAAVVVLVVSLVFSLLMQRTEHFYFAVGTLGLQSIIVLVVTKWQAFTHGPGGETIGIRPLELFGQTFQTDFAAFKVLVAVLAICLVVAAWVERSPVRREAIAVRDQPIVAGTLGLPTLRIRIAMFMLGSTFAAIAGSLYAHRAGSLSTDTFSVQLGLYIFLMAILGGLGSRWGAVVGSWFFVYSTDYLGRSGLEIASHSLKEFKPIVFGALLIIVMIAAPEGITGLARKLWSVLARLIRTAKDPEPTGDVVTVESTVALPGADADRPPIGATVLEARDITVSFGGVRAVDEVSLEIRGGEILGLIGPNGSGKSTMLNAITGVVPAGGGLTVGGVDVGLRKPSDVVAAGVRRTYQTPQGYLELSCIDNVLLSTTDRKLTGIVASIVLRPLMLRREKARWRHAAEALDRVGLLALAEVPAGSLSYGGQRMLELARVIAGDPKVVLLDEPSAGLNDAETELLAGHLRLLRQEGVSLLVVDHKIDFISSLCDRVIVLELGRLVAEGDPHGIWEDERVQNAYLGVTAEEAR